MSALWPINKAMVSYYSRYHDVAVYIHSRCTKKINTDSQPHSYSHKKWQRNDQTYPLQCARNLWFNFHCIEMQVSAVHLNTEYFRRKNQRVRCSVAKSFRFSKFFTVRIKTSIETKMTTATTTGMTINRGLDRDDCATHRCAIQNVMLCVKQCAYLFTYRRDHCAKNIHWTCYIYR